MKNFRREIQISVHCHVGTVTTYNYLSDSRAIQVKDLLNIVFLFLMETNMKKKKRPKSLNIEKNSVQTKKNNKDLVQQKTTIIK